MSNMDIARTACARVVQTQVELRQRLTERDAAVVRLHVEDGMSPPEIGRALGMSTSNVRLCIKMAKAGTHA